MLYDFSAVFVGFCLFNASMISNAIELKGISESENLVARFNLGTEPATCFN